MHDGRQRHQREIAQGNLECPGSEPELDGRPANRFQTRAVGGGVTKLPDPGETDLSTEMAADHPQAGRAAIHLVDLLDVLESADAHFAFRKYPFSSAKGCFIVELSARLSRPSPPCHVLRFRQEASRR